MADNARQAYEDGGAREAKTAAIGTLAGPSAASKAEAPAMPLTSIDDLPPIAPGEAPPSTAPAKAVRPAPVESPPGPRAEDPPYRKAQAVRLEDLNGLLPAK
jgi:hypothetical protein